MGGADDAHVHRLFLRFTQRPHAPLLNGAQQLGLHRQRQIADLVQEKRAALRGLKEALAVSRGAGVGALARAEELGFEQVFRNGAAVHGHEGAVAAVAVGVHRLGDQLFAGARFALHQHRRHAAGHLGNAVLDGTHRRRIAHHARQCLRTGAVGRLVWRGTQRSGLARRWGRSVGRARFDAGRPAVGEAWRACRRLHGRGDYAAKLLEIDRLGQVVKGAGFQRLDGVLGRAVGRDDDAALRPPLGHQLFEQIQAQAVGQAHVGDDDVKAPGGQLVARLGHVGGAEHLVPGAQQGQLVQRTQIGFVVHHQHTGAGGVGNRGSHVGGAESMKVVTKAPGARRRLRKNSLPSTATLPWARSVRS